MQPSYRVDALVWGLTELFLHDYCYGYAEYLKQEQERIDGARGSKIEVPHELVNPAGDGTLRCPACRSTAIARIMGVGWRCNQCGKQYEHTRDIYRGPSRGDVLNSIRIF